MKKNIVPFVFVTALICSFLFASSCNKGQANNTESTQQLITGNLSFDLPVFVKNGEYDSITAFMYKVNMDSFVKSFNSKYDTSSIRSVQLRSCILTMTNGDVTNNFRNFHTTNIGITSGTNGHIYRIAAATDIQDTAAYFLNVPKSYEPNLATYFKSDSICYRFYGNIRRATTLPINCRATLTYDMVLSK